MEKLTLNDFNGLVYHYGANGTVSVEGLNEEQKQIVYLAWSRSESIEDESEADAEINSYYADFLKAGELVEKKYTGYGYHGGGRKKTGVKRQCCHFSATPEQIEQLKNQAKAEGLNLSTYILKLAGIK